MPSPRSSRATPRPRKRSKRSAPANWMNRLDRLATAVELAVSDLNFVEVSGVVREVAPTFYRVNGLSSVVKLGDRVSLKTRDRNTIRDVVRLDEAGATVKPYDTRFPVALGMSAR